METGATNWMLYTLYILGKTLHYIIQANLCIMAQPEIEAQWRETTSDQQWPIPIGIR